MFQTKEIKQCESLTDEIHRKYLQDNVYYCSICARHVFTCDIRQRCSHCFLRLCVFKGVLTGSDSDPATIAKWRLVLVCMSSMEVFHDLIMHFIYIYILVTICFSCLGDNCKPFSFTKTAFSRLKK